MNNRVSYDQYEDIPSISSFGVDSKIIFSEEAYNYICSLIQTSNEEKRESGCFLVGRKSKEEQFTIYVDYATSEFAVEDANYINGSVVPTENVYSELNQKVSEYRLSGVRPCVFHYHTHTKDGFAESFADNDYNVYGHMAYHQGQCDIFGMLGHPVGNQTFGFSIVSATGPKQIDNRYCANYVMFPNIYYCKGNEINKVGGFNKMYSGRKTNDPNIYGTNPPILNFREFAGTHYVNGIGINPNTNEVIDDETVGYVDANGFFQFPSEKLQVSFDTIAYVNDQNIHR